MDGNWNNLYNQIYIANVVIAEVMDAADGTLAERESLRAEAYVHRAFAYWALVNLYAKHYNAATADEDLGVPLRLSIDFEESLKRASVQSVYNQILADLNNAVDKLPETLELNINYRPTNAAALGLLARVHLYMNNVDEAANFATQALALHNELIDFNTLGTSPIIPILLHYPVTLENKEVVFNKVVGSGNSMFYIHPDLVNLYDAANDLRYQTNCLPDWVFGANYGFVIAKFFGGQPTVGINTPELHLILAECYARKGGSANIGLAMDHLNTLREKRYATGADYELNATDGQTALRLVKEERRRELCFNGQRLFDIKRFNLLDGDNIGVSRTISG
ncbi:MAG: RagB/SusD family nutrient uptake outer membrane protein, partial [Chlorobiales bacterium]|nr:RagB/SusD family nutrient uptake outer membrane protein [Chlorobiales bacterium]